MTENSSCFNGVLRRILCTGNVPTHPSSDYLLGSTPTTQLAKPSKAPNHEPKFQATASPSATVSPGIVARLMGLDSLPETNWVRAPELVKRSKSVCFGDYLMDFELTPTSQHRRVRTSVSFREVPAAMTQPEGNEFLVVYLDSVDKGKEFGVKVKKTEEVKQGKEQRSKNTEVIKKKNEEKVVKKSNKKVLKLKDEPRRECGAQSSRVSRDCRDEGLGHSVRPYKKVGDKNGGANIIEGSGEHSPLKKTTTQKKKKKVDEPKFKKGNHQNAAKKREAVVPVDHSSCSENSSSPVSVFDIEDILFQHEAFLSEYSGPKDLKTLMKSPPRASYNEDPELRAVKIKDMEPIKNEDSELLARKIFTLTEEELKASNWVSKNVVEYERFEEICAEVEELILDMLMNQVIDDIVQLS